MAFNPDAFLGGGGTAVADDEEERRGGFDPNKFLPRDEGGFDPNKFLPAEAAAPVATPEAPGGPRYLPIPTAEERAGLAMDLGRALDNVRTFVKEAAPGFYEQITTSPLPKTEYKAKASDTIPTVVAKELVNQFTGLVEGVTSPAMVATGGAGGIVKGLAKPITAGFLADVTSHLPEAWAHVEEVRKNPEKFTPQERAAAGLNLLGIVGLTGTLGSHLAGKPLPSTKLTETGPPQAQLDLRGTEPEPILPPLVEQPTGGIVDASQNRIGEAPRAEEIIVPEIDQGGRAGLGVPGEGGPEGAGQIEPTTGGISPPPAAEIPEAGAGRQAEGGRTTEGGLPADAELRAAEVEGSPADQRAATGDEAARGTEGAERAAPTVEEPVTPVTRENAKQTAEELGMIYNGMQTGIPEMADQIVISDPVSKGTAYFPEGTTRPQIQEHFAASRAEFKAREPTPAPEAPPVEPPPAAPAPGPPPEPFTFGESAYHGDSRTHYTLHKRGNNVEVSEIRAGDAGGGIKFLRDLTRWADDNGLTLSGDARPMRAREGVRELPQDKLKKLYRQFGFEEYGEFDRMLRVPKPAPEAPAQPAPAPKPKPTIVKGDGGFSTDPLVRFVIDEMGGIMSKAAALEKWGKEKYRTNSELWEDAPRFPDPRQNKIYNRNSTQTPDAIASEAAKAGLLPPGATSVELWQALQKAADSAHRVARQTRQQRRTELSRTKQTEKQGRAFTAAISKQEPGEAPINASNLAVGDTVTIGNEPFKVTEIDPDTYDVTLEDGKRYGVQHVDGNTVFYGEHEIGPAHEAPAGGDPFTARESPLQEAAAPTPQLRPGQTQGSLDLPEGDLTLMGETTRDFGAEQAAEQARLDAKAQARQEAEAQTPTLPGVEDPLLGPRPGAAYIGEELASYEQRKFAERFQQDEFIDPEIRAQAGNRYYERIPNEVTAEKAAQLIEQNGVQQSIADVMDPTTSLPHEVRVTMGLGLIRKLNAVARSAIEAGRKDLANAAREKAVDLAEWGAEEGTKAGRYVQAFAMWARLDAAGKLVSFKRNLTKIHERHRREHEGEVTEVKDAIAGVRVKAGEGAVNTERVQGALRRDAGKLRDPRSLWQRYRESAISALANKMLPRAEGGGALGRPAALDVFTRRLAANLRSRLPEGEGGGPRYTREAITDEQLVREAYTNFDKYKDVWEQTQREVRARLKDHPEALESLDDYFGAILERPFHPRSIERLVKQDLEARGVDLGKLVGEHYSKADGLREDLGAAISDRLGLSKEHGAEVARAVKEEFERAMLKARSRGLRALLPRNRIARKIDKRSFARLLDASNKGALSDPIFYDAVAERLGLPKYDPAVAKEVMRLGEIVDTAKEGLPRFMAEKKLADYMGRKMGLHMGDLPMGVYYANILSGYNTQLVNFFDTAANVMYEVNNLALLNPRVASATYGGLIRGFLTGRFDAALALKMNRRITGGGKLIEGRTDFMEMARFGEKGGVPFDLSVKPGPLQGLRELGKLWVQKGAESKIAYPLRGWKYVPRLMSASDAIMFRGAEEARSALLAWRLAHESGLKGAEARAESRKILALDRLDEFAAQAREEGFKGIELEARVTELMDQARPADLRTDAIEFANEHTYNFKPRGRLGGYAASVASMSHRHPEMKYFVPFTQIVANVTNRGLNNSPWGLKRALAGYKGEPPLKGEARDIMLLRASLGTGALVGLGMLNMSGHIKMHGAGPSDPEMRRQMTHAGWKPYSMQVGQNYFSYLPTPFGLELAVLSNALEAGRYKEFDNKGSVDKILYAVSTIGSTVFSQTFLYGMANLFDILSTKSGEMQRGLKKFFGSFTAGFVAPNITQDIDRIWDPYARDTNSLVESVIRNIPGARRLLYPDLNAFGEPIKLQKNRFYSRQSSDPVWSMILDKGLRVPIPDDKIAFSDGYTFNEAQSYVFRQRAGQELKKLIIESMNDPDAGKRITAQDQETAQDMISSWGRSVSRQIRYDIYTPGDTPIKKD